MRSSHSYLPRAFSFLDLRNVFAAVNVFTQSTAMTPVLYCMQRLGIREDIFSQTARQIDTACSLLRTVV